MLLSVVAAGMQSVHDSDGAAPQAAADEAVGDNPASSDGIVPAIGWPAHMPVTHGVRWVVSTSGLSGEPLSISACGKLRGKEGW
jgi:hypothetical protein